MKRPIKLLILILISTSVYFIYQKTNNIHIKILTLVDSSSLENNSYCSNNTSYLNLYRDYLIAEKQDVTLLDEYSRKDLTIKELLKELKYNPTLKRELLESHTLFFNLGYNDLIEKLSLEENINNKKFNEIMYSIKEDYNETISEIRKYYKNDIIVIGYFPSLKEDYYLNKGIRILNSILESNIEIEYIDTYNLINKNKNYYQENSNYCLNKYGNNLIGNKIINEILAKTEKI